MISVYLRTMAGVASLGVQPKLIKFGIMYTLEKGDTMVIALRICVLLFLLKMSLSNGRIKIQLVNIRL